MLAIGCASLNRPTATPPPVTVAALEATGEAGGSSEIILLGPTTPAPTLTQVRLQTANLTQGEVVNIVDGDTIDVVIIGIKFRVRYIGVDTPETVHPSHGEEPYGREASEFNRSMVSGRTVFLERDVSDTDRYGRLLRYVWLEDGTMVNALLVSEGYAQVATFPPDVAHVDEFLALERDAREKGKGLWGLEPTSTFVGNCDPYYPTVCISQYPPDLNCGDIAHRRFAVLPPDPHGFDQDKDGVGCER